MRVVVSTGAGISKDSGLPVYRGDDGTWTKHPALERMSTAKTVAKNINVLWEYWGPFRQLVMEARPNAAHMAIARAQVASLRRDDFFTVITQNVDDLHAAALDELLMLGEITQNEMMEANNDIIELHGNIFRERCLNSTLGGKGCGYKNSWVDVTVRRTPGECPECDGPSRPDVVLFGEKLPQRVWLQAERACMGSQLYYAVGTSGIVHPAANLVAVAKAMGAQTVLVNKDPWDFPHPDFDETILGSASEKLPDLLQKFLP